WLGRRARTLIPAPRTEMIALDPDRRARLISFLEGNSRMPPDVKERLLSELQNDTVRAAMVQRLEARMGG
ncbi:MAG: efflux transporter periplasmic adaptor subunit, partial [Pseudomonadota bacterium]